MMEADGATKRDREWMPDSHHHDDRQYIRRQMARIDQTLQLAVAVGYTKRWRAALSDQTMPIKKKRYTVNRWLNSVVEFDGTRDRLAEMIGEMGVTG